MSKKKPALEPCPHCGAPAKIKDLLKPYRHGWVGCDKCGIMKQWTYSPVEAVNIWNRRKTVTVSVPIYDREEVFNDCTVQVLTNSFTGEQSVGWWKNGDPL